MSFAFGPLTDDYGFTFTSTSDGAGGLILTCAKYGTVTVTAAQLADPETERLVQRVTDGQDVETNWGNLVSHMAGIG